MKAPTAPSEPKLFGKQHIVSLVLEVAGAAIAGGYFLTRGELISTAIASALLFVLLMAATVLWNAYRRYRWRRANAAKA